MDERYRAILDRNRRLLVKNIILTEEFYEQLLKEKVLPEAMVRDVREGKTSDDRNSRLINALKLRANTAFRRFRNVLFNSGHCFIADILWEEESGTAVLDETIFARFPGVFQRVSEDTKKKLFHYLETKVREKILQASWKTSAGERVEQLHARAADYKQERHLRATLEEQDKKITALKTEVCVKDERIRLLTVDVSSAQREVQHLRQEHKNEMEKQTNFNMANNSTILRLKDRFIMFNNSIVSMNQLLRNFLGEESKHFKSDPDNVKITLLEQNLKKALQMARSNVAAATTSATEREEILSLLNKTGKTNEPLTDIVRSFVEREEKAKIGLWKDVNKLCDSVKGRTSSGTLEKRNDSVNTMSTDLRFLRNQIATVRVEVEHLHKKISWKDSETTDLRNQLESLRRQMSRAATTTPSTTPDMSYEMEMAYARADDYIKETKTDAKCTDKKSKETVDAFVNVKSLRSPTSTESTIKARKSHLAISQAQNFDVHNFMPVGISK